jgi:hypothetical protein
VSKSDQVHELERLATLHKTGELNDEEYATAKGRVIEQWRSQDGDSQHDDAPQRRFWEIPIVRWGILAVLALMALLNLRDRLNTNAADSEPALSATVSGQPVSGSNAQAAITPGEIDRCSDRTHALSEMGYRMLIAGVVQERLGSKFGLYPDDDGLISHMIREDSLSYFFVENSSAECQLSYQGSVLFKGTSFAFAGRCTLEERKELPDGVKLVNPTECGPS